VAIQLKALAQLMFDICHDKWKLIASERNNNPRFVVPKYNKKEKNSLKFHNTKYSDHNAGKGNGWNLMTGDALNECLMRVKKFRTKDKQKKLIQDHQTHMRLEQEEV
jgi:hypothetical protein